MLGVVLVWVVWTLFAIDLALSGLVAIEPSIYNQLPQLLQMVVLSGFKSQLAARLGILSGVVMIILGGVGAVVVAAVMHSE